MKNNLNARTYAPAYPSSVAVLIAGAPVLLSFSIQNDGNVALRGLVAASSDLAAVTCDPPLPAQLDVGSSIACQGSHTVSQDELEQGSNSYSFAMQAVNLVPSSDGIGTSAFVRTSLLPAVQLPGFAAVQVQLSTGSCLKPFKARESWVTASSSTSLSAQDVTDTSSPTSRS
jgi:hypothetical protein